MDQDAFRSTYREMNERACMFEKSNLSGMCRCSLAERFCLAEREGVHCKSDDAQQQCADLIGLLRQHSRFTLKSSDTGEVLSHNKSMRIQVGGMRGLYLSLNNGEEPPFQIEDIHGLVEQAMEQFGSLTELPFQEIIKQIAAYKGRGRKSR
jgi:hypothetical protein